MSCNIELCRSRTHQTKSKGSTISDHAYDASNILKLYRMLGVLCNFKILVYKNL